MSYSELKPIVTWIGTYEESVLKTDAPDVVGIPSKGVSGIGRFALEGILTADLRTGLGSGLPRDGRFVSDGRKIRAGEGETRGGLVWSAEPSRSGRIALNDADA